MPAASGENRADPPAAARCRVGVYLLAGRLLHVAGIALIPCGFASLRRIALSLGAVRYYDTSSPDSLIAALVLLAFVLSGFALVQISKRVKAIGRNRALLDDPRRPVLFLRSFQEDTKTHVSLKYRNAHLLPFSGVASLVLSLLGREHVTFEEDVARTVSRRLGPMVAVGRPGEFLPPVGCIRIYVGNDDWQRVVAERLASARAVIIQVSDTKGLEWEILEALRAVDPRRLLLIFVEDWMTMHAGVFSRESHEAKERRYAAFRRLISDAPGRSLALPEAQGESVMICFDREWRPSLLPLQYYSPIDSTYLGVAVKVAASLEPFLVQVIAADADQGSDGPTDVLAPAPAPVRPPAP